MKPYLVKDDFVTYVDHLERELALCRDPRIKHVVVDSSIKAKFVNKISSIFKKWRQRNEPRRIWFLLQREDGRHISLVIATGFGIRLPLILTRGAAEHLAADILHAAQSIDD